MKTIKHLQFVALLIMCLVFATACNKVGAPETKIKGKILAIASNNDSINVSGCDVYLISKSDQEFQLKRKSGKKGGFKFKNIPTGEYDVYISSCLNKQNNNELSYVSTVTITKEQPVVKLAPIITTLNK